MAAERTVEIPKKRIKGFSFGEQFSVNSTNLNQRMNKLVNNNNGFGGPQSQLLHWVDNR